MTVMLLEWVCTSIFLILAVLALRGFLKKRISAGLRYALWAVVLVRLLAPGQLFTSPVVGTRIFSELRTEHAAVDTVSDPVQSAIPVGDTVQGSVNVIQTGQEPALPGNVFEPPQVPAAPAAPAPTRELLTVLGWVWLGGSAALTLVFLTSNLRFARRLRRCRVPMEGTECPLRVYAAVGLGSPCLFGLVRPAVYVTPETAADPIMLRHVLAHETTHFRHLDHIWNLLRCVALAVHWWNPLVWLAVWLSRRDGELACDEGALKRLGDGERRAYGHTLLALVTAKPRPGELLCCATTMAGDKKSLMERIDRIAKGPKRVLWAAVAAVLILSLACACAFGQAAEPDPKGDQHNESEHWGPSVDLTDVPKEVRAAALDYGDSMYKDFLRLLELREPHVDVEFDDWRVEALEGPWTKTAQGTEVGVWRLDYTCHTPEPEQAKVLLAGGMTLSEDGWMTPTDSIDWLIFLKGEDGKWQYSHAMQGDASAEDQPDSDFFWTRATNGIPSVTDPHFTGDVTGVPGDVLSLAAFQGEDTLARCQAAAWSFATLPDGTTPEPGQIEFDDWRITSLKGPWQETVNGVETEVWRMNCEVHTTQPERADQAIVGGMYLTEDGWFCPSYPDCTYLVFTRDEDGGWYYRTAIISNAWGPDEERFSSAGQEKFWQYVAEELGSWGLDLAGDESKPLLEDLRAHQAAMEETGDGGYASILLGRSKFSLYENEPPISIDEALKQFDPNDTSIKYWNFAVVDMDGDGTDEVLVYACGVSSDMSGYLLLHQREGRVYGLLVDSAVSAKHWFGDLKTDGTFKRYDPTGTAWTSITRLGFRGERYIIDDLAFASSSNYEEYDSFLVNHQEATKAEFEAVSAIQDAKPDAVWYEFNEENILSVFLRG